MARESINLTLKRPVPIPEGCQPGVEEHSANHPGTIERSVPSPFNKDGGLPSSLRYAEQARGRPPCGLIGL